MAIEWLENPNEYTDDEFVEASNEAQSAIPGVIDSLWAAGARLSDIESELANALDNSAIAEPAGGSLRVEISLA